MSSSTTSRRATTAEAGVVAQLLHDFNTEFDTPTPGVAVLTERLEAMLARDDVVALLAGEPAVAVALITFRPSVWDGGPVALLEELYVQPELRGRGIGRRAASRTPRTAGPTGSSTTTAASSRRCDAGAGRTGSTCPPACERSR